MGNYTEIDGCVLQKQAIDKINTLDKTLDFRQADIIQDWKKIPQKKYLIVDFEAKVTSGTYIRGLADLIGKKLNTYAIAFNIKSFFI